MENDFKRVAELLHRSVILAERIEYISVPQKLNEFKVAVREDQQVKDLRKEVCI